MRFLTLNLRAFGPFSDFDLELSDQVGFHIFYGPNEAGKSSMLRGIRSLLYGMETRTSDDFIHGKSELRVGARLLHSDGRTLDLLRRKGRKNTLLDLDGSPLNEAALGPYLGGVDQTLFEHLYGLDHRTLVDGGHALLEGKGDVGQSLFAAGLGPMFRRLAADLEAEACEVWKLTGKKSALNQALAKFKEARGEVRRRSLSSREWKTLETDLASIGEQLEELRTELGQARKDQNRLERFQRAIPLVGRRQEILLALKEMPETPNLRDDFGEQRRLLSHTIGEREVESAKLREELAECREQLADGSSYTQILSLSKSIEELYRRVDGYLELGTQLRNSQGELRAVQSEADGLATDLVPGTGRHQVSLPGAGMRRLAAQVVESFRALDREMEGIRRRLEQKRQERDALQSKLADLGEVRPLEPLEQLDREWTRESKLDEEIDQLVRELGQGTEELREALVKLAYYDGDVQELRSIKSPLPEVAERYQKHFQEVDQQFKALQKELEQAQRDLESVLSEQERLKGRKAPPTKEQLNSERSTRDTQRDELAQWWEEGRPFADTGDAWANFLRTSGRTDELADRLFEEAERVTQIATCEREREKQEARIAEKRSRIKDLSSQRRELHDEWCAEISFLTEASLEPNELLAWLRARETVLSHASKVDHLREEQKEKTTRREALLERGRSTLAEFGEGAQVRTGCISEALQDLRTLIKPQREKINKRNGFLQEKNRTEREVDEFEVNCKQLETKLECLREQWKKILVELRLEVATDPVDLVPLLDSYEKLRELLAREANIGETLTQLQEKSQEFERQAAELAGSLLDGGGERTADVLAQLLYERLQEARKTHQRQQHLEEQAQELGQRAAEVQHRLELANQDMKQMLLEAGAETLDQLPEIEERVRKRRELRDQLDKLEASLRELSAGQTIESFCLEVDKLDADELPEMAAAGMEKVEQLETRQGHLREQMGEKRNHKDHLTKGGGENAGDAAADVEEAVTEIKQEAEKYILLTLAQHLLKQQIEEYRRTHQGPILQRAQLSFERLTRGFYPTLETAYDEKDNPVLVARESSGRKVGVNGLSDGTRDQLYLALRLATIEQQLIHHEPVPFVADDLLVHFDSLRAQAALELLADFSKKTQVLFFTHLERDRDLARELLSDRVEIHELERALAL